MTRWPPIVWLMVSVGSLLILVGNDAGLNPQALVPGILLIAAAFALSLNLAFGRLGERPRARGLEWLIPATMAFYVVCAAAAALFAGGWFAIAALAAGLIPLTAAMLIVAVARSKTAPGDGAPRETTSDDHTDPFPGIGLDDATPLGDTPERPVAGERERR
jgi:hypothetical protein